MKVYRKSWTIYLNAPIEEVWEFFSRPENLNELTPEDMDFEIISDIEGVQMYEGMMINYIVKPLFNIPMNWSTEITAIERGKYFVDDQRSGPFKIWHHEHHFEETDNGVKMTDILHYALPLGFLGRLVAGATVHKRVEGIFNYREKKVKDIWPE